MRKLITSLVLLAVVAVAVSDWTLLVTFSDNCVTPVAAQLVSDQTYGPFCPPKRSDQGGAPVCEPLDINSDYFGYTNTFCGDAMPNVTEINALPFVITFYRSSTNCTVNGHISKYYFTENYEGPMLVLENGATNGRGFQVTTTCSEVGVLTSLLCSKGCLNLTASEQCTIAGDNSLSQIGCAGPPVASAPVAETPSQGGNNPQAQPTAAPTTSPSGSKTPSRSSTATSTVSSVIGVTSAAIALIML